MMDKKEERKAGSRGRTHLAAAVLGCICMALPAVLIPCQDVAAAYRATAEPASRTDGISDKIEKAEKNTWENSNRKRKKVFEEQNRILEQILKNNPENMTNKSEKLNPEEMTNASKTEESRKSAELPGVSGISGVSGENESSEKLHNKETTNTSETRLPGSDFFRQVAGNIWEKGYESITAEEYVDLTSLQIDTSEKTVAFQLNHGVVQTMSYGEETELDTADLSVFTGLEWISIDRKLNAGDLQGLERLFGVYTRNTVKEMAAVIPHPELITELGIADGAAGQNGPKSGEAAESTGNTEEKNLEGIEHFPNLAYLTVDYRALEDISALVKFPALQGLMLEECDALTDYSPLLSLGDLEWLKIASDSLENIDFVGSMRRLTSLSIEGSRVKSLDVLQECPGLTLLNLTGNSMIEDYSVIGKLTELEELTLEMGHGGKLPSFEKLAKLERLSLKDVDDLSPLKDAGSVISLFLDHCSGAQLDAVCAMTDLDTLEIHRFSTTVDSLAPLTGLSKLTSLHLEDVTVNGNVEEIFGIPSLKSLRLDRCRVGIDFAQLPVNGNLEVLSMNGIRIVSNPGEEGAEEVRLSEHYELFDCFPNLTELYLKSLGLEDIAFTEKLPRLQHLDIRDNPVTSLKELQKLKDIRTVWYGGGTIVFP